MSNGGAEDPIGRERREELAALARHGGFFVVGIAPAGPPPHADAFRSWLERGCHGEMAWMERGADKRCNPELVLPGIRSIVALAMNYWQGERLDFPNPEHSAQGRIARYAWGLDYHDLMIERMRPLVKRIEDWGGEARAYVDTGPVLERDFAQLAGVGWAGKSTMLIHRHAGGWFFLGKILTTLELPPDVPESDHCGKCTRCMTACPTGAIERPYAMDARKCLSYWTIENKGAIPVWIRKALGNRIYGCDDCIEACPWNRFAEVSREATFQALRWSGAEELPGAEAMPLRDFLDWTEEEFRRRFRGSPIRRIKHRGFLRNVCVALGNVGDPRDLPALTRALDGDPLVAEHAQWAIEEIQHRTPGKEAKTDIKGNLKWFEEFQKLQIPADTPGPCVREVLEQDRKRVEPGD